MWVRVSIFYHRMGKDHNERARNASSRLWTMMNTRVGLTHRKLAMRSQFLCFEYVDQFGKVWLLHFKVVEGPTSSGQMFKHFELTSSIYSYVCC